MLANRTYWNATAPVLALLSIACADSSVTQSELPIPQFARVNSLELAARSFISEANDRLEGGEESSHTTNIESDGCQMECPSPVL